MGNVSIRRPDGLGENFIPAEFIPEGLDEYYLRNQQFDQPAERFRNLTVEEIEELERNGNTSTDWQKVLVTDQFLTEQIKNSDFFGLVRIGNVTKAVLEHHELELPVGIVNSRIIACDIGDDVSIQNVSYLAHYIISSRCILFNIDEMHTTNHAKFGNCIVKEGEDEKVRVWLDLMNESGSRRVLGFDGMIAADAYIWAKYRDDKALQGKLKEITQKKFDSRRGFYGTVGQQCVIKNSRILKDVKIGEHCYIKGANKLKNLTINSSAAEPTQIGEGVELVNGIIGLGCHIFYGCKAVRFVLGDNSSLKYGARLLNSYLGANSTVSCCEMLNNLIFPAHEQHHNNSFLIASLVKGQSNLAAGATIGSNHNSRSNDNEIEAGRGFWPGLCVSLKHSCRFASFILLAKGHYPYELDVRFPFSLLNNNAATDQLEIMPGFWWLSNMYAMARNNWKFQHRDTRKMKVQNIEFDCLAPDTVEEIIFARKLLEDLTAKAAMRDDPGAGRELLTGPEEKTSCLEILADGMEKSQRKTVVLRARQGYEAYGQMLHYYAVKNLIGYLQSDPEANVESMSQKLAGQRQRRWVNLGGQLVTEADLDQLRGDVTTGKLADWDHIHKRYDQLWFKYPLDRYKHSMAVLCELLGTERLSEEVWQEALDKALEIQELICRSVFESRKKDFDNPFRQATYRNDEEMAAAIGTIEDDDFVQQVRAETEEFKKVVAEIRKR